HRRREGHGHRPANGNGSDAASRGAAGKGDLVKLKRTHYGGTIDKSFIGKEIQLCGWVDRWRDHGGVVFIDLRDRTGILQVVFDPSENPLPEASTLRQEFVIGVKGKVRARPD